MTDQGQASQTFAPDEARGVDAVDRALAILDCVARADDAISLADMSRETGLYKSTILRLAISLERGGYIVRQDNGRFRLGPTLWRLGTRYRQGFDMAELVRPELLLLSEATRETASYYIREGSRRVCLYRREPDRAIRHFLSEGVALPLDASASACILRAWSSPETGADLAARKAGFAVSRGARDPEVAAVSVPVVSPDGTLRGALAVSGLVTRFTEDRVTDFVARLTESAGRLGAADPAA